MILAEYNGQYSRKLWFLYEWLMQKKLPIADLTFKQLDPLPDDHFEMPDEMVIFGNTIVPMLNLCNKLIIRSIWVLFIFGYLSISAETNPEISIVTDKIPGIAVSHGLMKLTDALAAKKISFEKVDSLQKAQE